MDHWAWTSTLSKLGPKYHHDCMYAGKLSSLMSMYSLFCDNYISVRGERVKSEEGTHFYLYDFMRPYSREGLDKHEDVRKRKWTDGKTSNLSMEGMEGGDDVHGRE